MFRKLTKGLNFRVLRLLPRPVQRYTSTAGTTENEAVTTEDVYCAPAVKVPTINRLMEIAYKNGLDLTTEDLDEYRDWIANVVCPSMDIIESYPEPTLPVKYPRTPGYRPSHIENKLNAWYWRCDINGANEGILQGKTVAIKDNIPVAGVPMMNGSYILEGYVPDYDATVITRVLDAGGRITGKASCEDLCFSGSGFVRSKGAVRNPHKMDHVAGGSSSGCAVLVATGEVDMAVASDQGGSIRIPSTWCGVVGMKPTYGLVPYTGIMPIDMTIDSSGPIAKSVYDCALLLEAIAGYDKGLDPRQTPDITVPAYTKGFSMKLPGIKIGILKEGFTQPNTEPDVATMVKKSAFQMITLGARVEEVSIPTHLHGTAMLKGFIVQGTNDMMIKGNAIGSQYKGFYPTHLSDALHKGYKTRINDMSHILKGLVLAGEYLKEDYGGRFYAKTQNVRRTFTQAYDDVFEKYDVLIMPTIPFKAPKLPTQNISITDTFAKGLNMIGNTASFNVSGHPALTINTGFSDGLPVGMMIVGRRFEDDTVLKVAYAYEKLRDKIESA